MEANEVISVNMSSEERLLLYLELFHNVDVVAPERIDNILSEYIDNNIEPTDWIAVWNVPPSTCRKMFITFPSWKIVKVISVDSENLVATVSVCDDEAGTTYLPSLLNLYPATKQEFDELNVAKTAHCLDVLRFFLTKLWVPWNTKNLHCNSISFDSWLRRQFEIINMVDKEFSCEKSEEYYWKIHEAWKCASRIKSINENYSKDFLNSLCELHDKVDSFQVEVFEMTSKKLRSKAVKQEVRDELFCIVIQDSDFDDMTERVSDIKKVLPPDSIIRIFNSLHDICELYFNKVMKTFLCYGEHKITDYRGLQLRGSVKATNITKPTTLKSEGCRVLLDCCLSELCLSNLILDALEIGILVQRRSSLIMKNCKVVGDKKTTDVVESIGVVVDRGSRLLAENCEISGFEVGILAYNESSVQMQNCGVRNCRVACKFQEEAKVTICNSSIIDFSSCGFEVLVKNMNFNPNVISEKWDILAQKFPNIIVNNCNINTNVSYSLRFTKDSSLFNNSTFLQNFFFDFCEVHL